MTLLLCTFIILLLVAQLCVANNLISFKSQGISFSIDPDDATFGMSYEKGNLQLQNQWHRVGHWMGFRLPIYYGYLTRIGFMRNWNTAKRVVSHTIDENHFSAMISVHGDSHAMLKMDITVESPTQYRVKIQLQGNQVGDYNRIQSGFQIISDDEKFYGFGERFNYVNQRGNQLSCWIEDGGFALGYLEREKSRYRFPAGPTSSYITIPFFISSEGYGILINSDYRTTFDMGHSNHHLFSFESESQTLDYTVFLGPEPSKILYQYIQATGGTSKIPPPWAFGVWSQLSGEFPTESRDPYTNLLRFINMDIPVSHSVNTVHFMPTQSQRGKEEQIKNLNAKMNSLGVKQTAYYNPYIEVNTQPYYDFAKNHSYFVKNSDGEPFVFSYYGTRLFHVSEIDFTNPEAVEYFKSLLKESVDLGFSGWMHDYAEYTPEDAVFYNGKIGDEMHNPYTVLYQQAAHDFLMNVTQTPADSDYAPDFVFYHRSGYTGSQSRTWGAWTGDPSSDFSFASGLPAQVAGSLGASLAGLAFIGSDIGGFEFFLESPPSPELWIRWAQFGVFSGYMHDQAGGPDFLRNKTHILDTPEGRFAWRKCSKLRTQLFPYIYTAAHEYRFTGVPLMRHHILMFPNDPDAISIDYQYTFGPSFLIAPVLERGQTHSTVYLPKDTWWYDLTTSAQYDEVDGRFRLGRTPAIQGPKKFYTASPLQSVPFFARAGSIVPLTDPSVFTFSKITDQSQNITSWLDVQHILHLWVFPESGGKANGGVYDGSKYSLEGCTRTCPISLDESSDTTQVERVASCTLSLSRPSKYQDTSVHIVQWLYLFPSDTSTVIKGYPSGKVYEEKSSFKELIAPLKRTGTGGSFFRDIQNDVLYVRIEEDSRIEVQESS